MITDSGGTVRLGKGRTATRWTGTYELAIDSLFGSKEGGINSTSAGVGSEEEIRAGAEAYMPELGTVQIHLSPLVSHGPLSLSGEHTGDTIRGGWNQRSEDFLWAPKGTFLMSRQEPCKDGVA